jgi:HD-like signal output (HDOD) protein
LRAIWRHSLACGLIAQKIADAGAIDRDTAYSAGVMHDVGRLALAVISPKPYARLLESHQGAAASILAAERRLFGFDHCEAGSHLVGEWKLPANFQAIVAHHHRDGSNDERWQLSDLIRVSCRIADTVGFTVFQGCEVTPYGSLLAALPERERSALSPDREQLAFEISSKINAAEVA